MARNAKHQPTHSETGLETIRLMGCAPTGWEIPPIKFVRRKRAVPTKVKCPTCHGTGQVAVPASDRGARDRCPTCPPRRRWPTYGTGEVVTLVEKEVEVGVIDWPAGTRFDARFGNGQQCALCGHRIYSGEFMAVLGRDDEGRPHGMYVGLACGRTILGVDARGITVELAREEAAEGKAAQLVARAWREIPKAPPPVKPAKPALVDPPTKAQIEALLAEAFGADRVRYVTVYTSRAELSATFHLEGPASDDVMRCYEAKLSARNGVVVRTYFGDEKPIVKHRDSQDLLAALREAADAIRRHAGLPGLPGPAGAQR